MLLGRAHTVAAGHGADVHGRRFEVRTDERQPERYVGRLIAGLQDLMVPGERGIREHVGFLREIDRLQQSQNGLALPGIERTTRGRRGGDDLYGRKRDDHANQPTVTHEPSAPYSTVAFSSSSASTAATAWCAVKSGCSGVTDTKPSRTA